MPAASQLATSPTRDMRRVGCVTSSPNVFYETADNCCVKLGLLTSLTYATVR